MDIDIRRTDDSLVISLSGELDHHAAGKIFESFSTLPQALPRRCTLDLGGVTFMDSSGIAVVLGLRRRLSYIDAELKVTNAPPQAMRVFRAAGIEV